MHGRRLGRGARMMGAAVFAVSALWMPPAAAAVQPPVAEIVNPENAKVFRPGDAPLVDGNAFAGLGVHAVKLEFWLLNKLERAVLAGCTKCKTSTASYWSYSAEGLLPGYYVVKAYAVDNAGNFSSAAQRGFVYGLQNVPLPQAPKAPELPKPNAPAIPAPTIDQPPKVPLPAAEGPVTIGGSTSGGGQQVRVRETELGPLGTVQSDDRGIWTFRTRLPSGTYNFRVQAVDQDAGRSRWSRIYRIAIDADRPLLGVATPAETVFTPTQPVVIEGTLFDERAPARIRLEYWLLDRLVLVQDAQRIMTSAKEAAWAGRPRELQPGYYYVRVSGWDRAGNPAHQASTTFVYAI